MHRLANDLVHYHSLGLSLVDLGDKKIPIHCWGPAQRRPPSLGFLEHQLTRRDTEAVDLGVIHGRVSHRLAIRDFDDPLAAAACREELGAFLEGLPLAIRDDGRMHVYFGSTLETLRNRRQRPVGYLRHGDGETRVSRCLTRLPVFGGAYRWEHPLGDPRQLRRISPRANPLIRSFGKSAANGYETQEVQELGYLKREPGFRGEGEAPPWEDPSTGRPLTCAPVSSASFADFQAALDGLPRRLRPRVQLAICRAIPTKPQDRHFRLFGLTRALKGLFPGVPPSAVAPFVAAWLHLARPFIRTQGWDENWRDFLDGWPRVRFPTDGLLVAAIEELECGDSLPEIVGFQQTEQRQLIALCAALQWFHGSEPFFLSARKAGEIVGVSRSTANRWMRDLQESEPRLLTLAVKHPYAGLRSWAAEYYYAGPAINRPAA